MLILRKMVSVIKKDTITFIIPEKQKKWNTLFEIFAEKLRISRTSGGKTADFAFYQTEKLNFSGI